ncbi:MAG: phospholipase D family protein [Alphaproteobacteria bacterium]|nr:phospholipase D family protein [Alphaproteobacteria bacterium]
MQPKPSLAFISLALFFSWIPPAHASTLAQRLVQAIQGGGTQITEMPPSVEVAFSPNGGATDLVIKAIQSARQSIRIAAYSFTSRPIAAALIAAHREGIDVEVVVDHGQIEKSNHSVTAALITAKIPLRVDIIHTLQHDKYMVIDGKTVETGSFNYTAAAEQHNSENVLVLWNAPKLAAAYGDNWKILWIQAEPYAKP